jgi:hypothetical protein
MPGWKTRCDPSSFPGTVAATSWSALPAPPGNGLERATAPAVTCLWFQGASPYAADLAQAKQKLSVQGHPAVITFNYGDPVSETVLLGTTTMACQMSAPSSATLAPGASYAAISAADLQLNQPRLEAFMTAVLNSLH